MKTKMKVIAAVCAAVIFAAGIGTSAYMNYKMNSKLEKVETISTNMKKENEELKKEISQLENSYSEEGWDDDDDYGYGPVGDVTYEEGDYYHENGELIEIGGEYKIRDFDYIAQAYLTGDDSAITSDADKETLKLATELLEEIITDDMTMYEKELAIHDWLCEHINYDYESLDAIATGGNFDDTPYGALKYNSAVCVGYATTFRLLTTMAGMECDIIHDSDYGHTWNIIKLDDGEYYLVDCYSDSGEGTALHSYFNLDEDSFLDGGYEWDYERYPTAGGTEYNYANMNSVELANVDELIEKAAGMMENGGELFFTMSGDETLSDMTYVLEQIMMRVDSSQNAYCYYDVMDYEAEHPLYSLTIEVDDFDYDDGYSNYEDLTIDTEAVDAALDEYFGEINYDYFY